MPGWTDERQRVSAFVASPLKRRTQPDASARAEVEAERAFTELYSQHFERVYRLVGRYGIMPADVEDVTQQVFGVALARRAELAGLVNARAWLAAITVRVVHEHYRWRRVRRLRAWLVEHSWAARGIDEHTPEHSALGSETTTRVRTVLASMSRKLRDALVLVELEELGTQEAAEILQIPYNTLRSRQRLARADFERRWRAEEPSGEREP